MSKINSPAINQTMTPEDIRVYVSAMVEHFGRKFPEETEEFIKAVDQKIHRLHKESGMSRGGTLMQKAAIPAKLNEVIPTRFWYWWVVEQGRPEEEWREWYATIKDSVYAALFDCGKKFCINKNSRPTLRDDGTGL